MADRKFFSALKTCSEAELAHFRSFAASPYHNRRAEWLALLDYLIGCWPLFSEADTQAPRLYALLQPGAPFNDKDLRYALSGLNQLLERFWAFERFGADALRPDLDLMAVLTERGLDKAYRQAARRAAQQLERQPRHTRYFQDQLQLLELEEQQFERQRVRRFDNAIQRAADTLDAYYYLQRLKLTCAMIDRQRILQGAYDLGLTDEWLRHLQQRPFFQEPAIQLFYHVLCALRDEEDENWFAGLKALLNTPDPAISPLDLRDGYRPAINYCARKIRQGRADYAAEALALYVAGIEKGYLLDRGELSPWTFTNVVKLSLRLARYEWIEAFIPQYAPLLPDAFRHNALHYNLAELYYYTQRYAQAQTQLNEVAWTDLNYYLGARVMLAKIYYEQDDTEPLLSLIAAFTIFLKRNKEISADLKQTYLNFCEILFQLLRQNSRKMAALEERIRTTPLLTDRAWLLEQCAGGRV